MIKQVFVTALTDVVPASQASQDSPGDLRIENGKVYKYVKFTGTTNVAAGDVVCYTTAADGVTVDGANTANGAGVAMAAVASGSAQNGWILVEGLVTLSTAFAGTSPAVGNNVTTAGATAPAVTKAAAVTDLIVGSIHHVANKIMMAAFPR